MKEKCVFHVDGKCKALNELFCENEKCKFYKDKSNHYLDANGYCNKKENK